MRLDGSNVTLLFKQRPAMTDIEVDGKSQKVFWSDQFGALRHMRLDGTEITTVVESDVMTDIALDPRRQFVYWANPVEHWIQWSNYDGSNLNTIPTIANQPYGIALDLTPVPEPSGVVCVIFAVAPIAMARRGRAH